MVIEKKKETHDVLFKKDKKALKVSDETTRRALLAGFCLGVVLSVIVVSLFVV